MKQEQKIENYEEKERLAARARLKAKQPLLELQAEEFARANRNQK